MPQGETWETLRGQGRQVIDELKRIVHEGNVRRVIVRQGERTVAEFPLTIGVAGALVAPVAAAVGALVALLADCRIDVEREVAGRPAARTPSTPPPRRAKKARPAPKRRAAKA